MSECYDLPPAEYRVWQVEMTAEQKKVYADLKAKAYSIIEATDERVTASIAITQMLRLHQIACGHTITDEGTIEQLPENRTSELIKILETTDSKAIIWFSYDPDLRRVEERLRRHFGDKSVARFWGGNVKTREAEEQEFKTNPECRFMLATPDAGRFSRTWDMANLVVYYSCTNDLDKRAQSEARPMNEGKTNPILYIDLQIADTVDVSFLKAIKAKIKLSAAITGNNWKDWVI